MLYKDSSLEIQVRLAAFDWLRSQMSIYGDVLSYKHIQYGFTFNNSVVTLVGGTAIWKPKICNYPISILTSVSGPYDDELRSDGYIIYKYQGDNPKLHTNVGLRESMNMGIPLIYFRGIAENKYVPVFPIYIHHDEPDKLQVIVQVDSRPFEIFSEIKDIKADPTREYQTVLAKRRIHQGRFRENVLGAYQCQCTFCKISHSPLLDAAHIISDEAEFGEPVINNGLALCKIHHAAFDSNIMGITPDYQIKVKQEVLNEKDGPMLLHGIQGLNNSNLILPRKKEWYPDRDRLAMRFEQFCK